MSLVVGSLCGQAQLQIITPASGSQFHPGDKVPITVRDDNRYTSLIVMFDADMPGGVRVVRADPHGYSLALPPDLNAGVYTITVIGVMGTPPTDNPDSSQAVTIEVEPLWLPSADGSGKVHDAPGVTVNTGGTPLRHRSAISYPASARNRGIEGTVVAELIPDSEGHVEGVHVLSGPVELAHHLIQSVATWHYAKQVGKTKPRRITVTFNLADAKRAKPAAESVEPSLTDNTAYVMSGSWDPRRLFTVTSLDVVGVSEEVAGEVKELCSRTRLRENQAITLVDIAGLRLLADHVDDHLRTYFRVHGDQVSVTIAPVGFRSSAPDGHRALTTQHVPATSHPERVRVSAEDQARKLMAQVPPYYPPEAAGAYIQGIVWVQLLVGRDGHVLDASAGGDRSLATAAERTIREWVYAPTLVNGQAVEVATEAKLEFFLPY